MKKNKLFFWVNIILFTLSFLVLGLNIFYIFNYKLLSFKNLNYIFLGINVFVLLIFVILSKKLKKTVICLNILYILLSSFIFVNLYKTINFFDKINNNAITSEYTMSVVVKKDSKISKIEDVVNKRVLAPINFDKENVNKLIQNVKDRKKISLNVENSTSYVEEYQNLISDKSEVIILNSAYENLIELTDEKYADKIKKIYEFKLTKDNKVEIKKVEEKKVGQSFNVYISGIDTYGSISTVSRSDVNIIMSVNTNTNKILLTTVPRDSYVKIAEGGNNQYDKLTHAGIYGVNASVKTLENLLDIKIDYYARVNFTSFLRLIDLVGGVEVYNEQSFKSLHGGFDFPVGNVQLDSKKALGFVRERYSLKDGDGDRARNQQKVITAIIKKLTSLNAISNYEKIITEMSNSLQTNMPISLIMSIANERLEKNINYDIQSQAVNGSGEMGLKSYAMPGYNLYMLRLDNNSVLNTSKKIKEILEGK